MIKKVFGEKGHMFSVGPDCGWYKICGRQKGDRVGFVRACFSQESVGSTWVLYYAEQMVGGNSSLEDS